MNSLDEIRKRKLEALQQQVFQEQLQEQIQLQQQLQELEDFVKPRLSKRALERFGNIKVVNPEKAAQLLVILYQIIQSGELNLIDDKTLKELLFRLQNKRDFKLTKR